MVTLLNFYILSEAYITHNTKFELYDDMLYIKLVHLFSLLQLYQGTCDKFLQK